MSGQTQAYQVVEGENITLYSGRTITRLRVANRGDRAIQVGSHYHFYEVNAGLDFDRESAWGKHLAIASGLAVRFEPGDMRDVELVDFGGSRVIHGFAGLCEGPLDDPDVRERGRDRLQEMLDLYDSNEKLTREEQGR